MGERFAQPLAGQPNIGPTIAARLAQIGVHTLDELRRLGAAAAYRQLKAHHPGVTLPVCYYLYSLQGALDGVHWNALPPVTKQRLLREAGADERRSRRAVR